jgi:hypothetical protein
MRLILAVPLSIAICPMLSYLLARFATPALWVFYIGVFAAGIFLLATQTPYGVNHLPGSGEKHHRSLTIMSGHFAVASPTLTMEDSDESQEDIYLDDRLSVIRYWHCGASCPVI